MRWKVSREALLHSALRTEQSPGTKTHRLDPSSDSGMSRKLLGSHSGLRPWEVQGCLPSCDVGGLAGFLEKYCASGASAHPDQRDRARPVQGCLEGSRTAALQICPLFPLNPSMEPPGASQVALVVKYPPANVGDIRDMGSIPGLGRSPGGGHGNPLLPGESHG